MADEPPPSFTITLREVWDELSKLRDAVTTMTPQEKRLNDHAQRLRKLERWMYALPGSLLLAIASIVITILASKH